MRLITRCILFADEKRFDPSKLSKLMNMLIICGYVSKKTLTINFHFTQIPWSKIRIAIVPVYHCLHQIATLNLLCFVHRVRSTCLNMHLIKYKLKQHHQSTAILCSKERGCVVREMVFSCQFQRLTRSNSKRLTRMVEVHPQ